MKLSEKAKKLPDKPGVYRFVSRGNTILYIGRATSLKKRIASYFGRKLDPRIKEMVSMSRDIKYETTDSVLEAIILEANLIKKFLPKYNVKDRDDRSFVYIVIPKSDFPKILIVRGRELKKFPPVKNFISGPYQSLYLVRQALKIIRKIFPYSVCVPMQGRPCFDYQIGLCPGVCIGAVSKEEYGQNIKEIILLLSGKKKQLLKELKNIHPEKIDALRHIQEASLIVSDELFSPASGINRIEGYDISHLTGKETYGSMVVFLNGKPDTSQYRLFRIQKAPANDDLRALEEMLERRFDHAEWPMPNIVLIDGGKPQVDFIAGIFRRKQIAIPLIGISKLRSDALVFPAKTGKQIKELSQSIKKVLQAVRDEAHRFALKSSRRQRKITRRN